MMITVLGPTASGKTHLAVQLADRLTGEIVSADSRQVYTGMDIGTGKDLLEYHLEGKPIPYHVIDICEAGDEYNVYLFQKDFTLAYNNILSRGKTPILCGGTGLYIESILKGYYFMKVPYDEELRKESERKSLPDLQQQLASLKPLHNTTDSLDRERLIRAIEIETARQSTPQRWVAPTPSVTIGLRLERELMRTRITQRLKQRIDMGMIDEVKRLIEKGVAPERLLFYGLEYKYITLYLQNQYSFDEMFSLLNIAIHQFAKRQMTWFRKMERSGIFIHWIDGTLPIEDKVEQVLSIYRR